MLIVHIEESDFHDCVGQVPRANMLQRRGEEFTLLHRNDVGNDDDHPRVKRFFAVENKEVGAIIGDERVLLLPDDTHKLPIFQPTESAVTDMVSAVAPPNDRW